MSQDLARERHNIHTCHDHCPCQTPGTEAEGCTRECSEMHTFEPPCELAIAQPEFKLGKPYIIPADAKNRFSEYSRRAFETFLRETWERFEQVLTAFPVEPSEPPPDFARDDDAQSEVGDEDQPDGITGDSLDLPEPERAAERVREFVSQFGDGQVPVDCVSAPLYARDLEALTELAWTAEGLRSELAEARRELSDLKAAYGNEHAAAERYERKLADMTAQRDRKQRMYDNAFDDRRQAWQQLSRIALMCNAAKDALGEPDVEITQVDNLVARRLADIKGRADLYLKERDEALTERDEAIRGAGSVAAKLAALRVRHNYLHDEDCESNEWGDDDCHCSGENGRLPSEVTRRIAVERDTAQAEVKAYDVEVGKLEEYLAKQPNDDADLPIVQRVRRLADRLSAQRVEYEQAATAEADMHDEVQRQNRQARDKLAAVTAERDALQARIDQLLAGTTGNVVVLDQADAAWLRVLVGNSQPRDLDPSSPMHWGEPGRRHAVDLLVNGSTAPPADDGSEAEFKDQAESLNSDAENESPPFKPGDWVVLKPGRTGYCRPFQVPHVVGDAEYGWEVPRPDCDRFFEVEALEPWQPRAGESVIRIGGAHEFPATVAENNGGRIITHDQADGSESVVTVEKLRPDVGSSDA